MLIHILLSATLLKQRYDPVIQIMLGGCYGDRPITIRMTPNTYPLNRIFLPTHPCIYIIKSHRTGEEESLAVAAVQLPDFG